MSSEFFVNAQYDLTLALDSTRFEAQREESESGNGVRMSTTTRQILMRARDWERVRERASASVQEERDTELSICRKIEKGEEEEAPAMMRET